MPQIIANGHAEELGFGIEMDPNQRVERRLGLKGVMIVSVLKGTSADSAGLPGIAQTADQLSAAMTTSTTLSTSTVLAMRWTSKSFAPATSLRRASRLQPLGHHPKEQIKGLTAFAVAPRRSGAAQPTGPR